MHNEAITHEYLMWAMCSGHRPSAKFDLYPVEGGTAAMCYIFKALKNARLLNSGDTIAMVTPIFTPYLEMPHLEDYALKQIHISADAEDRFQLTDDDLKPLEDKTVKALFIVNPGNPSAVAMDPETMDRLVKFVKAKRPDLMILTDDVYGTFVPNFESVMGHLPHNTIGVYSYSKYFGCTGWRLGVVAVAQDNIFDKMIPQTSGSHAEAPGPALSGADADAARNKIHRSDRCRQPGRGTEPHCGAFPSAAGDDVAVWPRGNDGRRQDLPEGVHGHLPAPLR